MGNDGGSIAKRAELVRAKKKEVRVESELVAKVKARAKYCALTKERLRKPVATCRIGYLYNYEAVLQAILDKKIPTEFKHIKKVSNLAALTVTENPDVNKEFPFICPISQKALNGKNLFYALWSCGCVFYEQILRDLKIKARTCPICSKPYTKYDIVELCPTNELAEMRKAELLKQMEGEREKRRLEEPQKLKQVCTEKKKVSDQLTIPKNKLEQLMKEDNKELKDSEIYKSLFHKEYKLEENLFTRNVRFGIR